MDDQPIRAGAAARDAPPSAYQLTLAGLMLPVWAHCAFNAGAAACAVLLGHPAIAAWGFALTSGVDAAYQALLRRWARESEGTDEDRGVWRLAAASFARVSAYLAAPMAMALDAGGAGELAYLGLTGVGLIALAPAAGALYQRIFWALALPVVLGACVAALALPWPAAAAILLGSASMLVLLALTGAGVTRAVRAWHAAFAANLRMIPELEAARDQAVAEREAADEAREAARRANHAKSAFLATMSHEIRTPMNGVLGMAQLLRRDEADPQQAARIETLIESGEHLLSILNDILDISKIDAGRLQLQPTAEDPRALLERTVAFWAPRAQEKGLRLKLTIAGDLPPWLRLDALRLRQVLFNLIGNALKFTEAGEVEVTARARPKGSRAVWLHLTVRDTGCGVAPEHLPLLFERFSQADESEMRRFGGTGLGLAIARQLVELMDGRVWAESRPGEGACFHLEIPLARGEAPAGPRTAARPPATPRARPLDVLAVDDNAVNLLVLEQLLAPFGHRVVRAQSGAEALERLAAQAFDLVLMDIQMPGMTGLEALSRLRADEGPNRTVPVIALTADVTSGGRERYLAAGFDEHAAKPIQVAELTAAVARAVAPRRRRRKAA